MPPPSRVGSAHSRLGLALSVHSQPPSSSINIILNDHNPSTCLPTVYCGMTGYMTGRENQPISCIYLLIQVVDSSEPFPTREAQNILWVG